MHMLILYNGEKTVGLQCKWHIKTILMRKNIVFTSLAIKRSVFTRFVYWKNNDEFAYNIKVIYIWLTKFST